MKTIDKIFCKIFNTNGGFEYRFHKGRVMRYIHKSGVIRYNYKKIHYPKIKFCNNGWHIFIELVLKHSFYQITYWNLHKYGYQEMQETDTEDFNPSCDYDLEDTDAGIDYCLNNNEVIS